MQSHSLSITHLATWLPLKKVLYCVTKAKILLMSVVFLSAPQRKKTKTMQKELSTHICTTVTELRGEIEEKNKSRR